MTGSGPVLDAVAGPMSPVGSGHPCHGQPTSVLALLGTVCLLRQSCHLPSGTSPKSRLWERHTAQNCSLHRDPTDWAKEGKRAENWEPHQR